jgi:hypothetical protein
MISTENMDSGKLQTHNFDLNLKNIILTFDNSQASFFEYLII